MAPARSAALAAALSVAFASAPSQAQPAPAAPTKAQVENAAVVLRVISSALQSSSVEQPVKNALFECLYANSVSKVSEATEKVIAANAGKVDRKDPTQMLVVIAGVCGYRPTAAPVPKKK
jgi:hypothetical protein